MFETTLIIQYDDFKLTEERREILQAQEESDEDDGEGFSLDSLPQVSEPPKKKMKLPKVKGLQHAIISVKSKVMSTEQAAEKFKVDLQLLKHELGSTNQPKIFQLMILLL